MNNLNQTKNISILILILIIIINCQLIKCQLVAESPCPISLQFSEVNDTVIGIAKINSNNYKGNNKITIKVINDNVETINTLLINEVRSRRVPINYKFKFGSKKIKDLNVIDIKLNDEIVCRNKQYITITSPTFGNIINPSEIDLNPIYRDNYCGRQSVPIQLIKQGKTYQPGVWPWLVALFNTQKKSYDCGGTLISHTTVITAAHCFQNNTNEKNYIIGLGVHDLQKPREEGAIYSYVKKIIVHSDYEHLKTASYVDIALVTLKQNIEYNGKIRPICLWNDSDDLDIIENINGYVAGWGLSDYEDKSILNIPKYTETNIVSDTLCLQSNIALAQLTSNTTFCAGLLDGSGPCVGDSGGGLVIKMNNIWYLRGIVSQSLFDQKKTCDLNNYVIYTDVAKLSNWITNNLKD